MFIRLTSLPVMVNATTNFCLQGLPSFVFKSVPSFPCRTHSVLVDFANTEASISSAQNANNMAKTVHKNFIAASMMRFRKSIATARAANVECVYVLC